MIKLYDYRTYMINLHENLVKMVRKAFLTVVLIAGIAFAGEAQPKYQFHHIFIYQFTKYIQWPANYQSGDFVIAVMGDSGITPYLESMAKSRKVGSQNIVIKVLNHVGELDKANIVFVPDNKSNLLDPLVYKLGNDPTLIITESDGMLERGSAINFVKLNDRIKYQLDQGNIEKHNLKVSTELLKFAIN